MIFKRVKSPAVSLLLCFLMVMSLTLAKADTPPQVPIGNILYDQAEELRGIAVVDDGLYMMSYTSLLRWRPGDTSVAVLKADTPFLVNLSDMFSPELIADGQTMYRFEPQTGRLQQLEVSGDRYRALPPVQLNWQIFKDDGSQPDRVFLSQDTIWMIQEASDGGTRLLRCELKEGARPVRLKVRNLYALTPMEDGNLLALQYDMPASNKLLGQGKAPLPAYIGVYYPGKDQFTPSFQVDLGEFPVVSNAALFSSNLSEAIYLAAGDRVWRIVPDEKQEPCAILPGINFLNPAGAALWASGNENLYAAGLNNVLIKSRDPKVLQDAVQLRINTNFINDPRAKEQVALNMGDTSLNYAPNQAERTQEELAASFLLNEVYSDVLVLDDYSFDLDSLGHKGYLLDLSGSQVLNDYVKDLDPKLQAMLWQDGKLVMVPYDAQMITPSAHADALEELGLSVPHDFFALCDLVERFAQENLMSQAPQGLLSGESLKETLIRLGVEMYFQSSHAMGGEVRFNDPLFRRMMEKVQNLGNIESDVINITGGDTYPIITLWNSLHTGWVQQEGDYNRAFNFFPMAIDQDTSPAVETRFTMLAINSRTLNPEQSIRFLEEAIATVDPRILVLLKPGAIGPILNPNFQHDLVEEHRTLALFENYMKNAKDRRTKESYELEIKAIRMRIQEAETTIRYLESEQTVAAAREIAQYITPQTGLMNRQKTALWNPVDLIAQYASGVITLEQFIEQADGKLRLIELENQ